MKHLIKAVDEGSIAQEIGITPGAFLVNVSGREVLDIVDYEQFTCAESLSMRFELPNGDIVEADIKKEMYEPIGLTFKDSLMDTVKQCRNHCLFCFIDQTPRTGRKTLHFKDDDWRLSLIMGNYVTLTNVDEEEFERILKRRVSPLYISVHSTDGALRTKLMRNPTAQHIMERLCKLKEAKLLFHAQIVLCPGINDGLALKNTLNDLYDLYPATQSIAIVPVGLTKYRKGLYPLRCLNRRESSDTIDMVHEFQHKCFKNLGTRLAYVADEMYIKAERPLPLFEEYEDFPQIENGVGLLRKFESEFLEELHQKRALDAPKHFLAISGVSAFSFMQELMARLIPYNILIDVYPIENFMFGETVTVTGLICGHDIINKLGKKAYGKTLIIPQNTLRETEHIFLDGVTLEELERALGCKTLIMPCFDGAMSLDALFTNACNHQ